MKKILMIASAAALLAFVNRTEKNEQGVSLSRTGDTSKWFSVAGKKMSVYTTAEGTELRLTKTDSTLKFADMGQPKEPQVWIFVDPAKRFQTMLGIGGALTDAAAETFAKLPKEKQNEFINAYYNTETGIGYSIGRINMNSCDFSSGSYTYVADNDAELKTFDIAPDKQFKLPLIKSALAATKGKLSLFISPWSPPAWMKDNNDMLHGGKLRQQYYQPWANYFVKYINALSKEGIPVWGLTVQNEPMATQKWESCIFTAADEAAFIKTALGPALKKAGLGNKKLIIWDHNRDLIYQRASETLLDPEVSKYVWGIGYHWYETWTGSTMMFDNVKRTAEAFPDKNLLFTEGCKERFTMDSINAWSLGERYGTSMINDFNNGTVGWTDWNILLDEKGGPNHVGNFCFAPVHADTKTGRLYYTSAYYYIGHLSKFVRPGAKRIIASTNRTDLLSTAFINPDGKVVIVVMNKGAKELALNLWVAGKAAAMKTLPHSISTVVIE